MRGTGKNTPQKYFNLLKEVENQVKLTPSQPLKGLIAQMGGNFRVLKFLQVNKILKNKGIKTDPEWSWVGEKPSMPMVLEIVKFLNEEDKKLRPNKKKYKEKQTITLPKTLKINLLWGLIKIEY